MKTIKITALLCLALLCSGCRYFDMEDGPALTDAAKGDITPSSTFGTAPEQVWVDKAKYHFKKGEYGLSERYFRQAIEERHSNVEAWLGLAASYDNLKRFDEADKAYQVVVKMIGNTATVLNNLGYHYMLKGDFASAEKALQAARTKDPNNQLVVTNLALLQEWRVKAGRG